VKKQEYGNKKPLICMMCSSLDGGWGRVLINLANPFKRMEFNVHFALDDTSGSFTKHLDPGIEVYPLKTSHPVSGIPYFSRYVLRNRPDIILTAGVKHTVLSLKVRWLTRVSSKIYPTIHNTYGEAFKELKTSKYRARLKKLQKYYPHCDQIVAVSEGVNEDFCSLTGIPAELVTTIYNPIYEEEMIQRSLDPIEHPWFQHGQPPVILGAGRLVKQKNFSLLIKAFDLLRSKTKCRLVIIGEGRERELLESEAHVSDHSNDIALIGFEDNPFPFLARSSVFVLSSSWEGFGNVLVEAMATGTPVVSTDCPNGPSEILMGGKYGRLVPMNDPKKLAEAIQDTLVNPLPSEVLKERASAFSIDSSAENYLRLFGLIKEN
jgi:glycosyltransferase involved in cell wall biosynthesis